MKSSRCESSRQIDLPSGTTDEPEPQFDRDGSLLEDQALPETGE